MMTRHHEDYETLNRWDREHVWHPFTPHSVYPSERPLMVVEAEGHELIDARGNRYLDGVSSLWCNVFGHRHPHIDAAVKNQLDRIAHATFLGNATAPAVSLAHRLAKCCPGHLKRVFYSDSGSTAVEVALKIALQYWQQADGGRQRQRTRFITLDQAYHGDTIGSVSLGGIDLFHARYGPLLFDTIKAPAPSAYRHPAHITRAEAEEQAVRDLESLIHMHGDQLAAVVIEPGVQGAAGMLTQPDDFLTRVKNAVAKAGALLIFDEVAVGFGRSGSHLFVSEKFDVVPDLLCLAKGLTGGYLPLAATVTTDAVFEAFTGPPEERRTFFHGHTYTGNPLGAAAAHATLDLFETTNILSQLPSKVDHLSSALAQVAKHPFVGDVRQFGLCVGIELVSDRDTKTAFQPEVRAGMQVCNHALDMGVFLRPLGDVLVLMPPLTLNEDELDKLASSLLFGLDKLEHK